MAETIGGEELQQLCIYHRPYSKVRSGFVSVDHDMGVSQTLPVHANDRRQFAMAYGGNGIIYSMIGAGLLRANIEGRQHPLAEIFGFSRIG